MALLLRKSDRVKVKIEELELEIAPLSFAAKMEINDILISADKEDMGASMKASKVAISHAVKSIKGIETLDGDTYALEFEGEILSEECVDELLNLEHCPKLMMVCTALIGGVPSEIIDPATGKAMKGVEIKVPKKKKAKK